MAHYLFVDSKYEDYLMPLADRAQGERFLAALPAVFGREVTGLLLETDLSDDPAGQLCFEIPAGRRVELDQDGFRGLMRNAGQARLWDRLMMETDDGPGSLKARLAGAAGMRQYEVLVQWGRQPAALEFYSAADRAEFTALCGEPDDRFLADGMWLGPFDAEDPDGLAAQLEDRMAERIGDEGFSRWHFALMDLCRDLRDPDYVAHLPKQSHLELVRHRCANERRIRWRAARDAMEERLSKPLPPETAAVWQPMEQAQWSGALRYEQLMVPIWMCGFGYSPVSMGWRMGGGEVYRYQFWDWYDELEQAQQEEFDALFPPPPLWDDMGPDGLPDWPVRYTRAGLLAAMEQGYEPVFRPIFHKGARQDALSRLAFSGFSLDPEAGPSFDRVEEYLRFQKLTTLFDPEQAERLAGLLTDADADADLSEELKTAEQFDPEVWSRLVYAAAAYGVFLACEADPDLMQTLLDTGDAVLVSVMDEDPALGTGRPEDAPLPRQYVDVDGEAVTDWHTPAGWMGENRYGFALMEARDRLRAVYGNRDLLERVPDERPEDEDDED
ncbi:MAG: DUF1768 domain-containing protein [Oscillospiraceae bacterium]|nr:DUF1768 domain-containing protein [Oscillospiraceae bacterium]